MKIVHLTDLHIAAPGAIVSGCDPRARLASAVADINRHASDADMVVATGDLSETGDPETYAALREVLEPLIPPLMLTIGNHDDRAAFASAFPEHIQDGFAQAAITCDGFRVVILDTHEPGQVGGNLCSRRLEWLELQLQQGLPSLLFLHHPPLPFGMADLDPIRLANGAELGTLLARHDIRHIGGGHVHRIVTGSWQGIPFAFLRSTNHQTALYPGSGGPESPTYAVIEGRDDDIVCHFREFEIIET